MCGGCDQRDDAIDALRAVLAPLLDDPFYISAFPPEPSRLRCVFCRAVQGHSIEHTADCPVRRTDALLGR